MSNLKIEKMYDKVSTPSKGTSGSACYDLKVHFEDGMKIKTWDHRGVQSYESVLTTENGVLGLVMNPYSRYMLPTGLKFEIPSGHMVRIYSRSGNSIKNGWMVSNGVGVIDSDYRDEVMVLMNSFGAKKFLGNGDRIAQMEMAPVMDYKIVEEEELDLSEPTRWGGFGSTGE